MTLKVSNSLTFALSLPFCEGRTYHFISDFVSIGNIRSYKNSVSFFRAWHTLNAQKGGKGHFPIV